MINIIHKIHNCILYTGLVASIPVFLGGCYIFGYGINRLLGAAMIAGAVSYVAAFFGVNEEARK